MAFRFLQWLSKFLQWLSNFPQRLSAFQEIRENLFMARSIRKITIRASYFLPLAPQDSRLPLNNTNVSPNNQGKDLSIQGGVEMNDATTMEGDSVIIGGQNIVQDGLTFIQELLTTVDFNNDEDQASNPEEVEWEDDGIGGSSYYSKVENDSTDSSIKLSAKHIKKNQKISSQLLLMKILMIEVKVVSLTTAVSLKHL
jgi:hypothetical protein